MRAVNMRLVKITSWLCLGGLLCSAGWGARASDPVAELVQPYPVNLLGTPANPASVPPTNLPPGSTIIRPGRMGRRLLGPNVRPVEFKEGERVVLLGDSLIQREADFGYLETRMTEEFPERNILFRNLAWDLDNALCRPAKTPDPATDAWFKQIMAELTVIKPTTVILGYGMGAAAGGEAGLAAFKTNYHRLMEGIRSLDTNRPVQFILLSPLVHETVPGPVPAPEAHNRQLLLYTQAVEAMAAEHNDPFINLYSWSEAYSQLLSKALQLGQKNVARLTDNGVDLTAYGYSRVTLAFEHFRTGVHWGGNVWRFGIMSNGSLRDGGQGLRVLEYSRDNRHARVVGLEAMLPSPFVPGHLDLSTQHQPQCYIQITGFEPGRYTLKIDEQPVLTASETEWARYVVVGEGPSWAQAEQLRQAVVQKNKVFQDRWRPAHAPDAFAAPGAGSKDDPMHDPLVSQWEGKIATLRVPVKHTFEVVRVGGP